MIAPLITEKEFKIILSILKNYPIIEKYYKKPFEKAMKKKTLSKNHPLIKFIMILSKTKGKRKIFLERYESLLKFHEKNNTKGFKKEIKSNTFEGFNHLLSILELCKIFIEKEKYCEINDDLLLKTQNLEIFCEIKTFNNYDNLNKILSEISQVESKYNLEIQIEERLSKWQVNFLIEKIKEILKDKKLNVNKKIEIPMKNNPKLILAEITINKKGKNQNYSTTGCICSNKRAIIINREDVWPQIENQLKKAAMQLNEKIKKKSKVIIIDLKHSEIDISMHKDDIDFEEILYGLKVTHAKHPSMSQQIYEKIVKSEFEKDAVDPTDKLFNNPNFKETCKKYLKSNKKKIKKENLTYLHKKGLFFKQEFKEINAVLLIDYNQIKLYPNPFIHKDILINEDILKEIFDLK